MKRGLLLIGSVVMLVTVGLVVARPFRGDEGGSPSETTAGSGPAPTTSLDDGPTSAPPATTQPPAARSLGTFDDVGAVTSGCPSGFSCSGFSVRCPDVSGDHTGALAVREPSEDVRGMIVLFSGGSGVTWWDNGRPEAARFIEDVLGDGLVVVEVSWSESWLLPEAGDEPGLAAVACRPATVIQDIHDRLYIPLGLEDTDGRCGFCVSGNSGGATQVAIALSHYGLEPLIDVAVLTGGPPHAGLASGCLSEGADDPRAYSVQQARDIDGAFGARRGGPCERRDPTFTATWDANDPALGGSDHTYAHTAVVVVLGVKDDTVAPSHARLYVDQLESAGSPNVEVLEVLELGHRIEASREGLGAVRAALVGA